LPNFFVVKATPKLHKEFEEYVEEYLPYVKYVCKKRLFLKSQWEDMEQFILTELISIYHKKNKYDDFDWVVRSVIRRKAIDFTCYYIKRNENIIFEDEVSTDNENTKMSKFYVAKSKQTFEKHEESQKIIEFILEIQYKINTVPYNVNFSDWDREYIEVVLELYEYGYEATKIDIMECMGYDKDETTKFNSKLLSFRNKMRKNLDIDGKTR